MSHQIVLVALSATVLLGAALVAVMRADRRRQNVAARLKELTAVLDQQEPGPSLRRLRREGALRRLFRLPGDLQGRFEAELAATGDRIGMPHLALAGAVGALVAIAIALRLLGLNPVLALPVGAVAALFADVLVVRFAQRRYQNRFLDVFPDGLDLIARAVRGGLPVFDAMETAGREIRDPVGSEFRRIIDELRVGTEIEDAFEHAAQRIRVPDFRFFVVGLVLQRRTGGHLAETLNNLSNIIRRRKEIRLKARALTAEARASAMVLTGLPFFVGVGLVFIARPLMQTLWLDPRGRFMVGIAVIGLVIGSFVMHAMIRRALR